MKMKLTGRCRKSGSRVEMHVRDIVPACVRNELEARLEALEGSIHYPGWGRCGEVMERWLTDREMWEARDEVLKN